MNEIRELTEMEVGAVSGGGLVDLNLNLAAPIAVAIGGFGFSCRTFLVAQLSDADAAREPSLDCRLDDRRCEEGHRQCHVDLADTAVLPLREAVDRGRAGNDLLEPLAATRDRADQTCTSLRPGSGGCALGTKQKPAGSPHGICARAAWSS